MIDYIIGFAFLSISILVFMNIFGWTNIEKIIDIPLLEIVAKIGRAHV